MAARYWWQCIACGARPAWTDVCESRSVAAFIRDELVPGGWDQRALQRTCVCRRRALYITYRLKRGDPDRVSIRHIVGLALEDEYLPMVWETFRHSEPKARWIDFKYQRGRSPWGLTKRLVLTQPQLSRLLRADQRHTGRRLGSAP